mgnify:CR=1 FL=1
MIETKSVRPFIGTSDFERSRSFYSYIGFDETPIDSKMSVFKNKGAIFYLQDYYVKDWIDNTMLFWEVENLDEVLKHFQSLELKKHFPNSRLSCIVDNDWGREFFLHDPDNILWHIGSFKS